MLECKVILYWQFKAKAERGSNRDVIKMGTLLKNHKQLYLYCLSRMLIYLYAYHFETTQYILDRIRLFKWHSSFRFATFLTFW